MDIRNHDSKTPLYQEIDIEKVTQSDISKTPSNDENKLMDLSMANTIPYNLLDSKFRKYLTIFSHLTLVGLMIMTGFYYDGWAFTLSNEVIIAYMTLIGIPNIYLIWKNRSVQATNF